MVRMLVNNTTLYHQWIQYHQILLHGYVLVIQVQMEIMKRLCNRGPYYRYRRYYRHSSQGGSFRCVCQTRNNQNQNSFKLDVAARRSSGDNSSTLLLNPSKYPQEPCYCGWHVDSKGHLCRNFVRHDDNLRRAQSCL